jgi:hypothetical protein
MDERCGALGLLCSCSATPLSTCPRGALPRFSVEWHHLLTGGSSFRMNKAHPIPLSL